MGAQQQFDKPAWTNPIDDDLDAIRDNYYFLAMTAAFGSMILPGWNTEVIGGGATLKDYGNPSVIKLVRQRGEKGATSKQIIYFNLTWVDDSVTAVQMCYDDGVSSPGLSCFPAITFGYDDEGNYTGPDYSQYLVYDTFTDSDAVVLSSHNPDQDSVGGGWTRDAQSMTIEGNKCVEDVSNAESISTIDAGNADVVITVTGRMNKESSTRNCSSGVVARFTDTSNYWMCTIKTFSTSPWTWAIYEVNGGSLTERASATGTTGGNASVDAEQTVTCNGQTIRYQVPSEGIDISYNSASFQETETVHGFRAFNTSILTSLRVRYDDLSITAV